MKKPILIIAEAGVNHNGDIVLAKQLVDAATNAGADIVKFQTFNADRLATQQAKKADYQIANSSNKETQYQMLSRLELSESMHHELIKHWKGYESSALEFLYVNWILNEKEKKASKK